MLYCTVVCISNNVKISQIEGPEEDIERLLTRVYLHRATFKSSNLRGEGRHMFGGFLRRKRSE